MKRLRRTTGRELQPAWRRHGPEPYPCDEPVRLIRWRGLPGIRPVRLARRLYRRLGDCTD